MLTQTTKQSIITAITDSVPTQSLYLFGSQATGNARPESDIDLAVILKYAGFLSYMERIATRVKLSKQLESVKAQYEIDVIVYTEDEWNQIQSSGSAMTRAIKSGEKLA